MTKGRRTDTSIFKRSDHTTKRRSATEDYYVYNRENKEVAGPFRRWYDGNSWVEERVAEQQRSR